MAEDWTAPPGTVKRWCNSCPREFASRDGALSCAYCVSNQWTRHKRGSRLAGLSPYEPIVGSGGGSLPARRAGVMGRVTR